MENLTTGEEENLPIAMRPTDAFSIEILISIGRQLRQVAVSFDAFLSFQERGRRKNG